MWYISYNPSQSLSKIKVVTDLYVNWETTLKEFRAQLTSIDVDAANLLKSFRYEKFTKKGFIQAYKEMALDRMIA